MRDQVERKRGADGGHKLHALPGARVQRSGASVYFVLTDHLGSASVTLDSTGVAVGEQRYYPFGASDDLTAEVLQSR